MSGWQEYLNNPHGRRVGDCTVRAVAKAIGSDWERAYAELALAGFVLGDMPSGNAVVNSVLKQYGFKRSVIPDTCPDCYTIGDFATDHPEGTYVVGSGNHMVCIEDGTVWDSWDSRGESAIFYWEEDPEAQQTEESEEEKKDGV